MTFLTRGRKLNALFALACMTLHAAAQSSFQRSDSPLVYTGRVLDGVTGAPIPDAVVFGEGHTVKTDSSGRFIIEDAVAGEVSTFKRGYFLPEYNGACCSNRDVLVGEHPGELLFTLMPEATLAGRVALPSGASIAAMPLTVLRQEVSDEGLLIWNISSRTETAADGSFKVKDLLPGSYRLRTDDKANDQDASNLSLTGNASRIPDHIDGLPRTYLQNGLEANRTDSEAISLHAGEEKSVNLLVKPAPFYKVIVRLAGPPIAGDFGWTLRREDDTPISVPQASASAENQLGFLAPAGKYRLDYILYPKTDPQTGEKSAWADGSKEPFVGSVVFEVQDRPVQVSGNAEHPRAVSVHIAEHFTHAIESAYPPNLRITDEDGRVHDAAFDLVRKDESLKDQLIELQPLAQGRHRIALGGSSRFYTATLTCGTVDLLGHFLEIGPDYPSCTIEAVLRNDFGALTVQLDPDGTASLRPPPGREHIPITPGIFARSADGHLSPVRDFAYPSRSAGGATIFVFNSLPPGHYLVSAFPIAKTLLDRAYNEPSTAAQLNSSGISVEVKPNQSVTVLLKGSLTPWRVP